MNPEVGQAPNATVVAIGAVVMARVDCSIKVLSVGRGGGGTVVKRVEALNVVP